MDPKTYSELTNTTPFASTIYNNIFKFANHCIFNITTFYHNISIYFDKNNVSNMSAYYSDNNLPPMLSSSNTLLNEQSIIDNFCAKYSNNTHCDTGDCFISNKEYENFVLYTIIASSCVLVVVLICFIKLCCR